MADLFKGRNDGIRVTIEFKDSSEIDVRQPWWWTADGVTKPIRPKGFQPTRDKQARGGGAWSIEMVVDVTGIRIGEHLLQLGDPDRAHVHLTDVETGLRKSLLLVKLWAEWEPTPETLESSN